ncbi:GtrA family protein [Streptomyces sp. 21So2-11]|uniref:GtrA family protein n=1 Tax=Streptomyces sp. 21So2-11 TaxID=3144408 RepID=UPI00321AD821
MSPPIATLRASTTLRASRREISAFAAVGLCAYAADLALFVWLRGPLGWDPLGAKAVAFLAGCTVAYAGNAVGTYRGRAAQVSRLRQYGLFFAVNAAGALVQLLCIAVSHYGLGLTSPRADTLSGAVVGMGLATCLRFWGTRTLVFRSEGKGSSWTG